MDTLALQPKACTTTPTNEGQNGQAQIWHALARNTPTLGM